MFNAVRIKVRVASRQANSIRKAMKQTINGTEIARQWIEMLPEGATISPEVARDWAKVHITVNKDPLYPALRKLYAVGWVLGEDMAVYQLSKKLNKALNRAEFELRSRKLRAVDWNNWRPGNKPAAALVKPPGGLQRLLDRRGIVIDELSRTTLNRIGTVLARSLEEGVSRETLAQNVRSLANEIEEVADDPERAVMIAQTEMASAVVQSNLDLYRAAGAEYLEYLVADPCELCSENLEASPISINESWPNGDPPVHPNCMCDVAPYDVDTAGIFG